MTLFMLPTNFRDSLLAALPAGPRWAIYGSLPHLTGLRPEQWLPAASEEAVARHVEAARRRGIPFYYALNYTCFGAQEFTAQWQRWVVELLAWLEGIGAEGVIVASPYLAELVKRRSTLRLHVSLGAQVDSVPKVLYWQEVGADAIYLDDALNRDFQALAAARKVARCQLVLSVNVGCILHCPLRIHHGAFLSHARECPPGGYVDYSLLRCCLARASGPAQMLKLPWIRPEDLGLYEEMGFEAFKIWGRTQGEEWLLRVATAYARRRYEGDLNDLLDPVDNVAPFGRLPYRLRNDRLTGFLAGLRGRPCRLGCASCRYCEEWAQRAVEVEGSPAEYQRPLRAILERLTTGCFRAPLAAPGRSLGGHCVRQ